MVLVYVDLGGVPNLVGRLWSHSRKGRESATFEYDKGWLEHPERFPLEPALTLGPGPHQTLPGKALFGAVGDSAPDRWGRVLMRRAERRRAAEEGTTPRTLTEIDYLLLVDDETRMGALRFAERPDGPFLARRGATRIPPLVDLPRLLSASERVVLLLCHCTQRPASLNSPLLVELTTRLGSASNGRSSGRTRLLSCTSSPR
jgi:serine/threonine-protein kinase HipA